MTLQTIFNRLTDIDRQIQALIREIGIDDDCGLGDIITPNRADPDEMFLFNELSDLLTPLCRLHRGLLYLLMPCSEVQVLRKYPTGRYGYDIRPFEEERTFSCGSPVEALIYDKDGHPRWVSSRIEHNGTDYYLYGYSDIPLNGLTIRERRYAS